MFTLSGLAVMCTKSAKFPMVVQISMCVLMMEIDSATMSRVLFV